MLLREVDRQIGLIDAIDECLPDPRDPRYTVHLQREMIAQRIFSIALGYEDLNDQQTLRDDPALQVAAGKTPEPDDPLASPPTLCRLENLVERIREKWPDVKIVIRGDSLQGDPQSLYDDVYTQRGDMENRIKEQQLMLFADRTSCHDFAANQFRLLLSSFAYVLLHRLRTVHLAGTELDRAQVHTIRLKLLKIAARVTLSARRVVLHLSSSCPYQRLFRRVAGELIPAPG